MDEIKIYTIYKNSNIEFSGSLKEISIKFNIKYNDLIYKMKYSNLSIEEIINHNYENHNIKIYTVFKNTDREFTGTLKQIAKIFNIKPSTLQNRINNNLTLEEAINYENNNNKYKNFILFEGTNKEFSGNLKDIAEHFNINYNVLKQRIYRTNLTLEECVDYKNNIQKYTVFKGTNKEFSGNIREIAKHFNINISTLEYRIQNMNLTFEEAILIPSKNNKNNLNYRGQKSSMRELCQKFDKNFIEVYNKVKYNHTFEWAMDSTKTPYNWKYDN